MITVEGVSFFFCKIIGATKDVRSTMEGRDLICAPYTISCTLDMFLPY
jgi:hypothetical protein